VGNRIGATTLGFALFILGAQVILNPRVHRFAYGIIDLSPYKIPLGFLILMVGILLIWSVLRDNFKE
jgi:hypothetical protein